MNVPLCSNEPTKDSEEKNGEENKSSPTSLQSVGSKGPCNKISQFDQVCPGLSFST